MRRRTLLASSLCVAIAGRNYLDRRHDPERMLDSSDGSIQDIAAAEWINPSYLVLSLAEKEWKMPPREWSMAKAQLSILFEDRFTLA
jgi:hypothetical protein